MLKNTRLGNMDKYTHLQLIEESYYAWLGHIIIELFDEFMLCKQVLVRNQWLLSPLTTWVSLKELDIKLEELWQKHQSKSGVEA
jgi:hypothetical protein